MNNTLEYVFFHQSVAEKLGSLLDDLGIEYRSTVQDDVITLSHADDLDDDMLERIENHYDRLFDEESSIINNPLDQDESRERDVVGVGVELADGRSIQVRLEPDITKRVLSVMTTEELRSLVNEIALQVEKPIDGPLCKGERKRG